MLTQSAREIGSSAFPQNVAGSYPGKIRRRKQKNAMTVIQRQQNRFPNIVLNRGWSVDA